MIDKIKKILFFLFAIIVILFIGLIMFNGIKTQYSKIKQEKTNETFTQQNNIIKETEEKYNELENKNELEELKKDNTSKIQSISYRDREDFSEEFKKDIEIMNAKYIEKYSALTVNEKSKKIIEIIFIQDGWKMNETTIDADKINKEDVGKIERNVGYTFPETKEIYVGEEQYLYGEISQANIFFHELGHVFHFEYMNISFDEEFLLLYEKHKDNYSKINSQVKLSHIKSSPEEFFADIFCEYCMDENIFKKTYPELYNFIDKNVTKVINEKLLDEIISSQGAFSIIIRL